MFNNNNFYGEVDGKRIGDCIKKIDYSLEDLNDRVDLSFKLLGISKEDKTQKADKIWSKIFEDRSNIILRTDNNAKYYIDYDSEPLTYKEFIKWCKNNECNPITFLEENDYEHKSSWRMQNSRSGIKINLNTSDALYSDSNAANELEVLGTYILAKDKIENNEPKEKVYTSKDLFLRKCKEENLVNSSVNVGNELAIFKIDKNYKKDPKTVITNKDYERFPILKEYKKAYDYAKSKFKELSVKKGLTEQEKRMKYLLRKDLGRLKQDMIDIKKSYERAIKWKQPLKDSGSPDWDCYDSKKIEQFKYAAQLNSNGDFQDDRACIAYDADVTIQKTDLTEKQRKVLNLWRKDIPISGDNGKGVKGIAEILGMTQQNVTIILNSALQKVIKTEKEIYEDWYYLNVEKGTYKKCSKCGEIKLIQRFRADKKGKYGVRTICKECEKKCR